MKREIARLDRRDGADRLAKQRRAASFRSWTDRDTGMWCFRGQLDPETGLKVAARIDGTVEALFHDKLPDDCPSGDTKQDWLRATAFARLVLARRHTAPTRTTSPDATTDINGTTDVNDVNDVDDCEITELDNRAELIIVIDWKTIADGLHEHSIIDSGHDLDLPIDTYRRLACQAAIIPLVLDGDGVALDLGREQRLANRQQRRAIHGMYSTCAIPGGHVTSRHCQPHHIHWWRRLGPTNLTNLIPLCSHHHHNVHEGGWDVVMHHDRSLTITLPDNTTIHAPPPRRHRTAA